MLIVEEFRFLGDTEQDESISLTLSFPFRVIVMHLGFKLFAGRISVKTSECVELHIFVFEAWTVIGQMLSTVSASFCFAGHPLVTRLSVKK